MKTPNNKPLWTIEEIVSAIDGRIEGHADVGIADITSVSIDSRTLERGALYVAIQGVSQDGHAFVGAAFEAGAHAALVSLEYKRGISDKILIRVDDTLEGLSMLGTAARERTEATVIAVTGSAGKTGTKEALHAMLLPSGVVHASVKSFNNHWGVPLSLARMPRDTDFAIFEVGMNHAGEIEPLSRLIQPDVALITTVAPVHIGHFDSVEQIADAKAEIFAGLKPLGAAVIPIDNPHFQRLAISAKSQGVQNIFSFGKGEQADFRICDCEFAVDQTRGCFVLNGERYDFFTTIPGEHIALNLAGALGSVFSSGGDVQRAIDQISEIEASQGRGNTHHLVCSNGQFTLIDESYNANPASMEIALKSLNLMKDVRFSRRIAVLGDMLELGDRALLYHAELAELINGRDIDLVFTAGPLMKSLFDLVEPAKQGRSADQSSELLEDIASIISSGDVVLVKGSQASKMALIVSAMIDRFGQGLE